MAIKDDSNIGQRMQHIVSLFDEVVYVFNSNSDEGKFYIALGSEETLYVRCPDDLNRLDQWLQRKKEWSFGYLSYELKNILEDLTTRHNNAMEVPLACFFTPVIVLEIVHNEIVVKKGVANGNLPFAKEFADHYLSAMMADKKFSETIELKPLMDRQNYISRVERLKQHIQLGDIYEVNYCQEFFAQSELSSPIDTFKKLNALTRAPFSAYMQMSDLFLLCASPERFLKKEGCRVISQPIKGTIKRDSDQARDSLLRDQLRNSLKEQTENVMIVDLVRNDLSRFAEQGSVNVLELFGVQSFKTVHHLVSTVECKADRDISFVQMIKATFPMGSMTGAPKIRSMQLIDELEFSARGLYSGSIGYITPEGDFDFNVIIRSLIYNRSKHYLSCHVGGAITSLCQAEEEYEECLLKASAVKQALRS